MECGEINCVAFIRLQFAVSAPITLIGKHLLVGPARALACAGLPAQFASAASLPLKFVFG
jgi:hypothetical protein